MNIRQYGSGDAVPVCALWNECLSQDQINLENFYRRIIYDVNFDPRKYLLAEENGKLLGFVYGVKRRVADEIAGLQNDQGWIAAMGTAPSCRRKGTGRALLDAIEKILRDEGAKKIDVGPYASNYFCPGVDREAYASGVGFLSAAGYETKSESCSMHLNLRGYETPEKYREKKRKLEAAGYRFKPYSPEDALSFFAFMREDFPYWLPDFRASILAGRAEKTLILAQDPSGATVGCVLRALDGTDERFGPFATKPSLQGQGIGTVLFHEMMENMVRSRIFYTYFLWTSGRNLDIYGTWGMKSFRSYAMMSKTFGV